ncbi:hypothetical protein CCAN12_770070 [Capnocytophaga canimorsus]|uniref:Uncharacterized protein n=2 Tax=Capnocytophaga canimorsus TaxID=28188 RepID=A0A0B7HMF7_9FLAO|nr:hypothetical protein CCAN12_770070 [Capnocytophaga canimorsus]
MTKRLPENYGAALSFIIYNAYKLSTIFRMPLNPIIAPKQAMAMPMSSTGINRGCALLVKAE